MLSVRIKLGTNLDELWASIDSPLTLKNEGAVLEGLPIQTSASWLGSDRLARKEEKWDHFH